MVQDDKISCNIPISSLLGPFGAMKSNFGDILGHLGAILGPPWASEKGPGWSNMTYNHAIYPWEVFRVIWGHAVPF